MRSLFTAVLMLTGMASVYAQDYQQEARSLLTKNLLKSGLHSIDEVRITDAYPNKSSGTFLVYIQQLHQNIRVSNAVRTLVFKEGLLIAQQGDFVGKLQEKAPDNLKMLSPIEAVNRALDHLKIAKPPGLQSLAPVETSPNQQRFVYPAFGLSEDKIPVNLLWIPQADGRAVLTWEVGVSPRDTIASWLVRVEATSGRIVNKVNLTVNCSWDAPGGPAPVNVFPGVESVLATQVPAVAPLAVDSARYRVVPFPAESPAHPGGDFAVVVNPWEAAGAGNEATTLKWHHDGTNEYSYTRGNNVYAQEDVNSDNFYGIPATSTTPLPKLTFTQTFDPAAQPGTAANQAVAITNLFYWNNIIHDVMYQYGFDEPAGNFQNTNLGRGGIGNDFVIADAQDGGGTNNANFSTPADGSKPRMQMYLFSPPSGSSISTDGDFDNGIIVHEYGHGISARLTGGPSQVTCLQNAEQMGEGWSDYYALMFTTDWTTAQPNDGSRPRTIAAYARNRTEAGSGIRTYPYTTDMGVNPLTYTQVSASTGVHYIGSIWCTMLWDLTWEIIRGGGGITPNLYDETATGGNIVAMRLVTEGLKLQPCSPGFVDGRNAILKADTLLYGGKYSCAIWRAFARRGVGASASQGSSNNNTDQTPAFDNPFVTTLTKTVDVATAATGQEVTYRLAVDCHCSEVINYTVVDTLSADMTYVSGGTYSPDSRTVTFGPVNLSPGQSVQYTFQVVNNVLFEDSTYFTSSAESLAPWVPENEMGTGTWQTSATRSKSPQKSWFIAGNASTTRAFLVSPAYTLSNAATQFSFWHYFDFEYPFDGGVIEISTDNASTWSDLGSHISQNGYNAQISTCCNSSLSGRRAFTGYTGGFIETKIDLSAFKNQTIRLRFQYAEDNTIAKEGWYIDDVVIQSKSSLLNTAYLMSGNQMVAQSQTRTPVVLPKTIMSVVSGPWNSTSTWSCGCLPQPLDIVTIGATHTVTIDGIAAQAGKIILDTGNLTMANNGSLRINK